MCGIVGFTGKHQAAPILLDGLSKLEYRGYDSAGIAVRNGEGETEVIKAKGRLKVLSEKTNGGETVPGTCGIGHTRWATHGEPSENNAHPQFLHTFYQFLIKHLRTGKIMHGFHRRICLPDRFPFFFFFFLLHFNVLFFRIFCLCH